MKLGYKHTLVACCTGYVVQAVINNFSPLLYVLFAERLGVGLARISLLITVNFVMQIGMDFIGTVLIDKIGYRKSAIIGNAFAFVGLALLGILPIVMENKFLALLIATVVSAVGGGFMEVVISPIVEALPKGEACFSMSFLHSFYCWGHAGVILISTVFFALFSIDNWYLLALIWTALPLFSGILLCFVPINALSDEKPSSSVRYLLGKKEFWLFMIVMLAAGASELGMAQWASFFAEEGLGVSKAWGDLLGPFAFAVAMGTARLLFGIFSDRIRVEKWIFASFALAVVAYLATALSPLPALSLLGCAVCGVAVALLWPGSYTHGAQLLPRGGTPMFALFALAGDLGCAAGPSLIGLVSDAIIAEGGVSFLPFISGDAESVGIRTGLLLATAFPLIAVAASIALIRCRRGESKK